MNWRSFSGPDVTLCGWLGSKHQLTNQLTNGLHVHPYLPGERHGYCCRATCFATTQQTRAIQVTPLSRAMSRLRGAAMLSRGWLNWALLYAFRLDYFTETSPNNQKTRLYHCSKRMVRKVVNRQSHWVVRPPRVVCSFSSRSTSRRTRGTNLTDMSLHFSHCLLVK